MVIKVSKEEVLEPEISINSMSLQKNGQDVNFVITGALANIDVIRLKISGEIVPGTINGETFTIVYKVSSLPLVQKRIYIYCLIVLKKL